MCYDSHCAVFLIIMQKYGITKTLEMKNMIRFAVNACSFASWLWACPSVLFKLHVTMSRFLHNKTNFSCFNIRSQKIKPAAKEWFCRTSNSRVNVFLPQCTCCNTQWQYFSFHVDVHIFLLWMLSDALWTKCFVFFFPDIVLIK